MLKIEHSLFMFKTVAFPYPHLACGCLEGIPLLPTLILTVSLYTVQFVVGFGYFDGISLLTFSVAILVVVFSSVVVVHRSIRYVSLVCFACCGARTSCCRAQNTHAPPRHTTYHRAWRAAHTRTLHTRVAGAGCGMGGRRALSRARFTTAHTAHHACAARAAYAGACRA